jgi:hypothetical protein
MTDDGKLDVDAALELASLEMDIERSLQGADEAESEFQFVGQEELTSANGGVASDTSSDGESGGGQPSGDDAQREDEPAATEVGDDEPVAADEDGDAVAGPEER